METLHPDHQSQSARTGPLFSWLLAVLLLLSFLLRLWLACQGLHTGHYGDERFAFRNVTGLLQGEIRPRHAFYPSLSYLPQSAVLAASWGLHELTGIEALSIFSEKAVDGYSPTAYLLCRLCNVLFGVLALWMVFLIGRRIHSPAAGLLAAAVLAALHRHVLSSTQFKPDILVLFLTTVTFYWTLAAAFRPALGRYARVGAGIGLAVSAKYTGIASCLPITAAALCNGLGPRRDRCQLGWLVAAGLISIATFVVLNPFLGVVLHYIPLQASSYAARVENEPSGHWVVFIRQIEFLIVHHGWLTALFVLAGTVGLLWRYRRPVPGDGGERRVGWLLVLSLFLGYSALHTAGMTLFRSQNYLPVAPFTSLIAAWAMVEAWRALVHRVPALSRRPAAATAVVAAGLVLLADQAAVVYKWVIPNTWAEARHVLTARLAPIGLRHVVYEKGTNILRLGGKNRALITAAGRLGELGPAFLERADAEVFPDSRLHGPDADFYRRRLERLPPDQVVRVSSRPFHSRGETLVLLLHPWRQDGRFELPLGRPPQVRRRQTSVLPPGIAPGDVLSAVLWAPREAQRLEGLRLDPGGELVRTFEAGSRARKVRLMTRRFALTGGETRVRLVSPPGRYPEGYRLELYRWRPR
ncbi:MAG TPA: glycosyltransferase family 39 protein [Thermoanaerobaculia bacterium]|nr:glycosyltransferase family 39 protein [Thermoanaerobaculia bacterium]